MNEYELLSRIESLLLIPIEKRPLLNMSKKRVIDILDKMEITTMNRRRWLQSYRCFIEIKKPET